MKKLRRRLYAKVSGLKYTICRDGYWYLGNHRICIKRFQKVDDKTFAHMTSVLARAYKNMD